MAKRREVAGVTPPLRDEQAGSGLPRPYRRACRLAEQGRSDQARRLYASLEATASDSRLKALVANDLAVLSALDGDLDAAVAALRTALDLDAGCEPARLNTALLRAEPASPSPRPAAANPTLPPPPAVPSRPVQVAVLSFLFNWPSTGGGIVHTVELVQSLIKAGYDVCHLYASHPGWGVGRVDAPTPYPSQALDFDDASWNLPAIQDQFRRAVAAFDPDHVLITDSWNMKPLLAEAVRGYPYILRLQAMECLCPLNNVRLLPEPGGGARQCQLHQLATPDDCARCVDRLGRFSGSLHQAERALSGVGTPGYHDRLLRAFRDAEAVLVVNPLTEAIVSPYAKCVKVVTAGIDPARFPWPPPDAEQPPVAGGRKMLLIRGPGRRVHPVRHAAAVLVIPAAQQVGRTAVEAAAGGFRESGHPHAGRAVRIDTWAGGSRRTAGLIRGGAGRPQRSARSKYLRPP